MFNREDFSLVTVRLDGKQVSLGTLSSVRVQQRLSMPGQCELHYRHAALPEGGVAVGSSLHLEVDWAGPSQALFEGEITAVEYGYTAARSGYETENELDIIIRAYDRLHRLRKHQRVRSFEDLTFGQLASRLSSEHGLGSARLLANHNIPPWPLLIQHQQTDLEFLVELAAQEGLYLSLSSGRLEIINLEGRPGAPVRLQQHDLIEARLEVNADSACERVEASGWSTSLAADRRGAARSARSGRQVEARVSARAVGGSGQRQLVNEMTPLDAHARALAQAELDWRKASEVTLWARGGGGGEDRSPAPPQPAPGRTG